MLPTTRCTSKLSDCEKCVLSTVFQYVSEAKYLSNSQASCRKLNMQTLRCIQKNNMLSQKNLTNISFHRPFCTMTNTTNKLYSSKQNGHADTKNTVLKTDLSESQKNFSKESFVDKEDTTASKAVKSESQTAEDTEKDIAPSLAMMTNGTEEIKSAVKMVTVIPGKGPPPEPPVTCCMSGCANCVWIAYAEELRDYYADGGKAAIKALEQIEDPSLRAFVKLELGL